MLAENTYETAPELSLGKLDLQRTASTDSELNEIVCCVRNVGMTYPNAAEATLYNISLTLRRNHVTAILGQNGSGKTTTMLVDWLID